MGFLAFFNVIKLNIKVRKSYNKFFHSQESKKDSYQYMDAIPQDVTDIYKQLCNYDKFKKKIDLYQNYEIILKKHNDLLDDIYNKINAFSLDAILINPTKFDYDSTTRVYSDVYRNINSYIDISTVKNNLKGFEVLKLKMLRWVGLRLSVAPEAKVGTYIAIPYNPYYPNDYMDSRWNTSILDGKNDILIQEDYWNLVGGNNPDTYNELLDVFKEVGIEMKETIGKLFC